MPLDISLQNADPASDPFAEPDFEAKPRPDDKPLGGLQDEASGLVEFIRKERERIARQNPEPEPPKPLEPPKHRIRPRTELLRGVR